MVVGLHLPFNSLPLAGVPGRHLPMESESIESLSFGEILKIKEKQLPQEQQISASSIAAALVSLQTQALLFSRLMQVGTTGDVKTDSSLDGSPQLAVDATVAATTSIATQRTKAHLSPTEAADPVYPLFSNIRADAPGKQIDVPQAEVAPSGSEDISISVTTIDTHLEILDNPAKGAGQTNVANDTSQVGIDRSEQGHTVAHVKSSSVSTPVQIQSDSTRTKGIQQPMGSLDIQLESRIEAITQETFIHSEFQPNHGHDTDNVFFNDTRSSLETNRVPAQDQMLRVGTDRQSKPSNLQALYASLSPSAVEQPASPTKTEPVSTIYTHQPVETNGNRSATDGSRAEASIDKTLPSNSSQPVSVESVRYKTVIPLSETDNQWRAVDSNRDTSTQGRIMALPSYQPETLPHPTTVDAFEAEIAAGIERKPGQPAPRFLTPSNGIPFAAQSETVHITRMTAAEIPAQEVEEVSPLPADSELEPAIAQASKSLETEKPSSTSSFESQFALPDALHRHGLSEATPPVLHRPDSTTPVRIQDLPEPEYSTPVNRLPLAAQGEGRIDGLDLPDPTSGPTNAEAQNTRWMNIAAKQAGEVGPNAEETHVLDKTIFVSVDESMDKIKRQSESGNLRVGENDDLVDFSVTTTKDTQSNLIVEKSTLAMPVSTLEKASHESLREMVDELSSAQPVGDFQHRSTQSQKLNDHVKDAIDTFEPSVNKTGTDGPKIAEENSVVEVPEFAPKLEVASAKAGEDHLSTPSIKIDGRSVATQQSDRSQDEASTRETKVTPDSQKIDVAPSGSRNIDASPMSSKALGAEAALAPSTDGEIESIEAHLIQRKSVKPSFELDGPSAETAIKVVEPKDLHKSVQVMQSVDLFDLSIDDTARKNAAPIDVKVVGAKPVPIEPTTQNKPIAPEKPSSVPEQRPEGIVRSRAESLNEKVVDLQPDASETQANRILVEKESATFEQDLEPRVQSLDAVVDVKVADSDFVILDQRQRSGTDQSIATNVSWLVEDVKVPSKPDIYSHAAKSSADEATTASVEPKEDLVGIEKTSTPVANVVHRTFHSTDAEVDVKVADIELNSAESKPEEKPIRVDDLIAKPVEKPAVQTEAKEEIGIRQTPLKDEETRPAEKRIELNEMHQSVVPANGPVNEARTAELNSRMPIGQVHAQAAEVTDQVIRQMKVNFKSGLTSMHMQLNPKDLGAIDVEMVSSAQGVQVTFFAEQPSTGRLLETQLNQLRDSLVESGVQLSGLNIGQHNTQGQKGGTLSQDTNFAAFSQWSLSESNVEDVPVVQISIGQSSEIDYRI